jgi:hypothetical protein
MLSDAMTNVDFQCGKNSFSIFQRRAISAHEIAVIHKVIAAISSL